MISLVMLSGGIDSVYTLYRLLKETDDEVLVHHIHHINNSNRHIPERAACEQVVKYCQEKVRPVAYTQSALDRRRFLAHGQDIVAAGFEAGVVAASYYLATSKYIDRWMIGLANDDQLPRHRVKHAQDCCEYNCQAGNAPELYLYPPVSLQDQVDYIPSELMEMTWSCRNPVTKEDEKAEICGKCEACQRRSTIGASNGTASSEILTPLPWPMVLRRGEERAEAARRRGR